jgi:D-hexose-6-phosphate mutarotase
MPDGLAARFAVPGLHFDRGAGGLTVCRVRTDAAEADVYLHGGHVTHYQPAGQPPVLFLSEQAVFADDKPIRGGIPICFPWFSGNGPREDSPAHGFARTMPWELVDAKADGEDVVLSLRLTANEATRELWPHDFVFDYKIRVGRTLTIEATVTSTGAAFDYELALHTYFHVSDVRRITLAGFDGSRYIDQLDANEVKTQRGEPSIDGEVDRIYQGHTSDVTIHDGDRRIVISKTGGNSTVLWNPHVAKAARMADFGDDEWSTMLCVESAAIGENRITLAPGESHTLHLTIDGGLPASDS